MLNLYRNKKYKGKKLAIKVNDLSILWNTSKVVNLKYFVKTNQVVARVSNRNSVTRICSPIPQNCALLRIVYRARNCAQVKSICVGNPIAVAHPNLK